LRLRWKSSRRNNRPELWKRIRTLRGIINLTIKTEIKNNAHPIPQRAPQG
jgi:hypothetical protein